MVAIARSNSLPLGYLLERLIMDFWYTFYFCYFNIFSKRLVCYPLFIYSISAVLAQKQVYASKEQFGSADSSTKVAFWETEDRTAHPTSVIFHEVKLLEYLKWIIISTSKCSALGFPALRPAREFHWKMMKNNLSKDTLLISYIAVEALIAVTATLGNALVIWVVRLIPANQNTTYYFIASLALADIAVGILVIPLAIVVSLGITMHFYACLFACSLLMVFSHASILSLMAIAMDRYLRVKFPTQWVSLHYGNGLHSGML